MPFLAALAGVGVVSKALGFRSRKKARSKQRSAEALQNKRSAIANVQNRRAAAAALRRQQAQQSAAVIANGIGGGSGAQATRGSIESQTTANVAYQQQQVELGAQVNAYLNQANRANAKASNIEAIGGLAGSVANIAGALTPAPTPTVPGLPTQVN